MAVAAPAPEPAGKLAARTTGGDIQNQCTSSQTAKCCEQTQKGGLLGLLGLQLGLNCINIPVLAVLGSAGVCDNKSNFACCSSGDQYGLVNIGNACNVIPVNLG
ncbi:MAG: hypothetical protein Q9169_006741 [Polycauliona sp. 2 TL-2023]